jgi:hypothetical protein
MSSHWYYSHGDGRSAGPVSTSRLKELATSGSLLPEDLIRKKGSSTWRRAGKARGLFGPYEPAPGVVASVADSGREAALARPARRKPAETGPTPVARQEPTSDALMREYAEFVSRYQKP